MKLLYISNGLYSQRNLVDPCWALVMPQIVWFFDNHAHCVQAQSSPSSLAGISSIMSIAERVFGRLVINQSSKWWCPCQVCGLVLKINASWCSDACCTVLELPRKWQEITHDRSLCGKIKTVTRSWLKLRSSKKWHDVYLVLNCFMYYFYAIVIRNGFN